MSRSDIHVHIFSSILSSILSGIVVWRGPESWRAAWGGCESDERASVRVSRDVLLKSRDHLAGREEEVSMYLDIYICICMYVYIYVCVYLFICICTENIMISYDLMES
jgi:hypothetical protein